MEQARDERIAVWAVAVLALAFAVRFIHITAIQSSSPFFTILPGDLAAYDRWARQIVDQGWLGSDIFYQDPLYPYFLALLYKVFGRDFYWVYMVQALIGAATSLLLVLLGHKMFSRPAGVVAGALYALYGPAIYFDGLLLKVTTAAFLITLSVYLAVAADFKARGPLWLSGFFLGLACLTRANFLLLLPVFFFFALMGCRERLPQHRFGPAVVFLVGVFAALGPVVARNYVVGRELVLTTAQAGQNFYIGHNPAANGTYSRLDFVRPDPLHEQEDFRREAERRTGRQLSPAEASHYWLRQGLAHVQRNPGASLNLVGRKLLLFLNNYEIPDSLNFYFHQRYSPVLRMLPLSFGLLTPFFMLGLLGMLAARRRGPVFLFLVQAAYMLSVIMFYVLARYRMAVLPLFCLSAAYGVIMLKKQFRRGHWRKLAASLLVVGSGYGIAHITLFPPLDFSHSFHDEGIAYEMKEDPQKALLAYQKSLAINPDNVRTLERMANLQLREKQYQQARTTFARILALDPDAREAEHLIRFIDSLGY